MMKEISIRMVHKKSTKGTEVYAAPEEVIRQVYIEKEAFDGKPPAFIALTVREA